MDLTNIFTIKHLCKKYGLRPNRSNGQNFLIDKNILEKIVAAAELKPTDTVLEIGPGFGVLTQELVKYAGSVVAVEKDKRLVEYLIKTLKHKNIKTKFKIINDDILRFKIYDLGFKNSLTSPCPSLKRRGLKLELLEKEGTYKIVSNLPYQITSPVLWKFLHEDRINLTYFVRSSLPTGAAMHCASSQETGGNIEKEGALTMMILMMQKEVAERICAKKGKMSILSVMCQFYAKCEIISFVSRNCFWPRPEVESAILRIAPRNYAEIKSAELHEKLPPPTPPSKGGDYNKEFMRMVKIGFSARRKMLKNNLANSLQMPMEKVMTALKNAGLNEKIRAQELGVEEWIALCPPLLKGRLGGVNLH